MAEQLADKPGSSHSHPMSSTISLTVTHRGTTYALSLPQDATIASMQDKLKELTSIPPAMQKLLYKGKKPVTDETTSLAEAGLKDGLKVQMLGSTTEEIGGVMTAEEAYKRKDRILRERAMKAPTKVRSTGSADIQSTAYTFQRLEPLLHLPNPSIALTLLTRLSNDLAIRHIMRQHKFSVGLLTELAPHEHPGLLGLNVNAGQAIKLRLRTDAYDGFRAYGEVRRVLCHELTHNVWGDHDNNFKELNSKLNREVAEFDAAQRAGTRRLGGGDMYEPSSELEAEARAHNVLGGEDAVPPVQNETREERRRRVLEATISRLQKEEKEIEQSCGTNGAGSTSA